MAADIIELLKVVFLGIIEGVTEWLPISSTGHMLLIDELLHMKMSDAFKEMFFVVIQFGAILAVVITFFKKMWPFPIRDKRLSADKDILLLWLKVIVACIPGAIATLLLDDVIDKYLHSPFVIAAALIFYGAAFLWVEHRNKDREMKTHDLSEITFFTALMIGLFQVLSIIPGTSRSGATIIGALLIGVSRVAAAEFSFFLAAPALLGWSALKMFKFGFHFSGIEMASLLLGMLVAFGVSLLVIRFLMEYIKKHDFKFFGWYRIGLGSIVIVYFIIVRYVI